jgi:hypothetical protein
MLSSTISSAAMATGRSKLQIQNSVWQIYRSPIFGICNLEFGMLFRTTLAPGENFLDKPFFDQLIDQAIVDHLRC